MSWFIAPLRPLSHTGQVLLCAAAALLAAALMVAWTPAAAEAAEGDAELRASLASNGSHRSSVH